jgi:Family of unknown function (DUF6535)
VTAFIIEGSRALQQNSADATVLLLTQISRQLAAARNESSPVPVLQSPDQVQFTPPSSVLRMNILWYLSLACALICALSATMVELWGRVYIQTVKRRSSARISAKTRIFLRDGAQRYHVAAVVGLITSLMHAAVMLFMAGLVEFMSLINPIIHKLCVAILSVTVCLYAVTVVLPLFRCEAPYQAPLSALIWRIGSRELTMADYREKEALETLTEDHVLRALRETVDSLVDDTAFEPCVDGIPGFFLDKDETPNVMFQLLFNKNKPIIKRLNSLLESCLGLVGPLRSKRIVICMNAMWSCFDAHIRDAEQSIQQNCLATYSSSPSSKKYRSLSPNCPISFWNPSPPPQSPHAPPVSPPHIPETLPISQQHPLLEWITFWGLQWPP